MNCANNKIEKVVSIKKPFTRYNDNFLLKYRKNDP